MDSPGLELTIDVVACRHSHLMALYFFRNHMSHSNLDSAIYPDVWAVPDDPGSSFFRNRSFKCEEKHRIEDSIDDPQTLTILHMATIIHLSALVIYNLAFTSASCSGT